MTRHKKIAYASVLQDDMIERKDKADKKGEYR